jgi:signal transduction histidine kinase
MSSDQISNTTFSLSNYIASNAIATIIFLAIAVGTIILLVYIISRIYKNNESMKNEFITIIAHKYNTPLSKMKWISETLFSEEQEPYKKESLGEISKANEQLIKLTGTLIELTDSNEKAKAAYSFERINACELVKQIGEEMKFSFHEKNISFSIQCAVNDIFIKADKTRIEFAIQVLLQNACIYTSPGRSVSVTISKEKSKAVISITDMGIGIDPSDMYRIFTKFYRTKNAQLTDTEGLGVGLYLARSIVKKHKGKIEVFSEGLNKGSTFSIILPAIR